ncbi:MAG: DNA-binding response OmpR family regulator, partial [Halioglobus sp.]
KILIVDDEETILEEVAETLTDGGYEFFDASDVETAA